ncbi:MAG: glycosyltransferase family 4 protein [Acidobacteriota bacterium]
MYENSPGSCVPRRVLITSDSVSENWPYSLALARGLTGLGIQVGLATFGPQLSAEQRHQAEALKGLALFESRFSPEWTAGYWRDQHQAANWLLDLERRFAPDVVHLNGLLRSSLPWNKPTVVVVHRCMASWWLDVKRRPLPGQWDLYRHQAGSALRSAGLVVSSTQAALAALREHYGPFPAGRVIPHGFTPAGAEAKRGFIITAQRLWDESSNLQALEVSAPFLSWPVFCAGESLDETGGRSKLQAWNICCLGALPEGELEQWLLESSIYVLPVRYPDCQVSVLQAASAGCALVLGNHPILREVWDDAAVFVPSEEAEALRLALDHLIRDEDRRSQLAERARQKAGDLSLSAMTEEYCCVYHDVMVSGTRSPGVLSHAVGS